MHTYVHFYQLEESGHQTVGVVAVALYKEHRSIEEK